MRGAARAPIVLCFVFIGIVAVLAVFGDLLAPYDPNAQDLEGGLIGPTSEHWFGTDDLGRDVFSRTLAGTRSAVIGPLIIAIGAMLIGSCLGLTAGYRGGRTDSVIMRWVDLMYALPSLLVAIVIGGVLGGGYVVAIGVLIVLFSPYDTRLIRGATLEQRPLPYVEAARTLGLSGRRIMSRHIFPNVLPIITANTFLDFAFALVALSSLSFLGIGVAPGTADWGRMLFDSRTLLFENPLAALAPAAMIVLIAASMNLIGDWWYERLSDRGRAR
jgi:peptide/nickel transport system permease protein